MGSITRRHLLGLALLTGMLLALGWPAIGDFSPVLFLAFIPLLFAEHHISSANRSIFGYSLLAFITFNILTTWWVSSVSEGWATRFFVVTAAIMVNSLMMTLVFSLFHYTKKHLGARRGYIALIVLWLAFEYFHLNWELTWPWLSLGNGFANQVSWIQWYEYTGTFGGSFWILLINLLIFTILKRSMFEGAVFKDNKFALVLVAVLLIVPIVISKLMYTNYTEEERPVEIAILQPNVDPYNEKYATTGEEQLLKMLSLLDESIDGEVDYIVAPETALSGNIQENA
ncbi:MAG: apolipoprotein N-acyltransferase, partial [Flavobacteriales bacterium]|nr:apolipoprotein N-acyltransferase [Flavobacteriales bacterium]